MNILVTDLVPSEIACFANSPGRIRRTLVWISRDEMVDFLEYAASSANVVSILARSTKIDRRMRTGSFSGDTLEDVVDKRVQDSHSLVGDTSVRVYLLEHYTLVSKSTKIVELRTHPCRCKSCRSLYVLSFSSSSRHQQVLLLYSCSRSSWLLWLLRTLQVLWKR